jgi:hypothetical protein
MPDFTGVSTGLTGTAFRRAFSRVQKASKSSGTGRLGLMASGSKPAPAVAVTVCLEPAG